jgi:hypothetical protein
MLRVLRGGWSHGALSLGLRWMMIGDLLSGVESWCIVPGMPSFIGGPGNGLKAGMPLRGMLWNGDGGMLRVLGGGCAHIPSLYPRDWKVRGTGKGGK